MDLLPQFLFETLPYLSVLIFIPSDRAIAITDFLCGTVDSYREGTYLRVCQARKEGTEQKQKRCLE